MTKKEEFLSLGIFWDKTHTKQSKPQKKHQKPFGLNHGLNQGVICSNSAQWMQEPPHLVIPESHSYLAIIQSDMGPFQRDFFSRRTSRLFWGQSCSLSETCLLLDLITNLKKLSRGGFLWSTTHETKDKGKNGRTDTDHERSLLIFSSKEKIKRGWIVNHPSKKKSVHEKIEGHDQVGHNT